MKINVDRTMASFAAEGNDKKLKQAPTATVAASTTVYDTKDELALSSRKAAVLSEVRDSNLDAYSFQGSTASDLNAIKEKLSYIGGFMQSNPQEAMAAQANLDPEIVAGLVG